MSRPDPFVRIDPCDVEVIRIYRLAKDYRRRMFKKWVPRYPELQHLDEFHRTRVAYEGDMFRAEELMKCVTELMTRVLNREAPFGGYLRQNAEWFDKCRNKHFLRVYSALKDAHEKYSRELG